MFPKLNSRFRYVLSVFAVVTFIGCWLIHPLKAQTQTSQSGKIHQLFEQRLELLRNVADITRKRCDSGQATLDDLWTAIRDRDEAVLEMASSTSEKVAALEKLVSDAREAEQNDAKLFAKHLLSETSLLRARAERLRAEIALEQEKNK